MEQRKKSLMLKIGNMTCVSCEDRIQRKLNKTDGILYAKVSFSNSNAEVIYEEDVITVAQIKDIIEEMDYKVLKEGIQEKKNDNILIVLGTIAVIYALYMLSKYSGLDGLFNIFPQVNENMGYGILFIIGILTSFHCIAMCGGINLSQCMGTGNETQTKLNRLAVLKPGILYNTGRVISYTIIGGIVGALGSVFQMPGNVQGFIQIIAGVFMVIMGFNMLNIFPWLRKFNIRMPKIFARKINMQKGSNSPFYIGLLNGLMPCGPLQAMQLYALSTGDPIKGALSMLLFSLGTVPLMFLLGAVSSILSKKFAHKMVTAGAVLVVVLGITMFSRGLSLTGYAGPSLPSPSGEEVTLPETSDGVQKITTTMNSGRYEPITVKAGVPVEWTIKAEQGSINGCNYKMVIPKFGIEKELQVGDNVINFTPTESGKFAYSCWMGMIRSSITVIEEDGTVTTEPINSYKISPEELVIAEIRDGVQYVTIDITNAGFSPAVVVMQKDLETTWSINIDQEYDSETAIIGFPLYNQQLTMTQGENTITIIPTEDFEFSANDNSFFGYVKVVDDVYDINEKDIKEEVSQYKPIGWDGENAGGCCG